MSDPLVLQANAKAREAAELLTHPNVSSVLVADGEKLVGCIGAENIVAAVAKRVDMETATAKEVADADVVTISPDMPPTGALLGEGAIVRPLSGFGSDTAIRVTAGTPEENAFFADALARIRTGGPTS